MFFRRTTRASGWQYRWCYNRTYSREFTQCRLYQDLRPKADGRLGHYRLLEPIGTGGMGVVYRARDERLERDVAIKVLSHGRLPDDTARRRFRTEALALSRLNHPNIATIHDFDTDAGIDFLVMEYIPGASLDARVREGGLSDAEVRHIGVQLAHGLRAAHERGVIHGDLKPANLRLTLDGRLKILYFGLARLLQSVSVDEADRTCTMEVAGTLPYMAPERFHGVGSTSELISTRWAPCSTSSPRAGDCLAMPAVPTY